MKSNMAKASKGGKSRAIWGIYGPEKFGEAGEILHRTETKLGKVREFLEEIEILSKRTRNG